MKELKYTIIILTFIIIVNVSTQQNLPPIPCPEIFQYQWDRNSNQFYGQLRIYPNTADVKLLVNLSIVGSVTSYGALTLLYGRQQALNDVMQNKPIDYKIEFPPSQQIPRLTSVNVNGATICNGPPENGFMTSIMLDHLLQTKIINLNAGGPQFSSVSPNQITNVPPRTDVGLTPQQPAFTQPPPSEASVSQSVNVICGTIATHSVGLVIGGQSIAPGSWPWLSAIFEHNGVDYKYKCGGTLVSSRIVLTAAHCFKKNNVLVSAEKILIVLGRHNLNNWAEPTTTNNQVKEIKVHEEYRSDLYASYDADIAIVVLIESVIFTAAVRPACMWPSAANANTYNQGLVVGWGIDETKKVTPTPNKVAARIASDIDCLRSHAAFSNITTKRTFCAGFRDGTGPCSGDSGTGLLVKIGNKWYLRGSVAGSLHDIITECDLKEYVVYADITQFSAWIYSYTQKYG